MDLIDIIEDTQPKIPKPFEETKPAITKEDAEQALIEIIVKETMDHDKIQEFLSDMKKYSYSRIKLVDEDKFVVTCR